MPIRRESAIVPGMAPPDHAFHWSVLLNVLGILLLFGVATVAVMAILTRSTRAERQARKAEESAKESQVRNFIRTVSNRWASHFRHLSGFSGFARIHQP